MITAKQAEKLEAWRKGAISYAQHQLGVPWVDAEDCVQDAILRIQAHGNPREDYTVGYLSAVLHKVVVDYRRRNSQLSRGGMVKHVELEEARSVHSESISPLENAIMQDALDKSGGDTTLEYTVAKVTGARRSEKDRIRKKLKRCPRIRP